MNDSNQLDNFFMGPKRERDHRTGNKFFHKLRNWLPSKEQFYYLPRVLSRNERFIIVGLATVAFFSLLAIPISAHYHATVEVPAHGGSWTEAIVGAPQHINPLLLQANDADSDLTNLIFAGLLRYDRDGALTPDLAESYTVSDDGLEYTFKLKSDLRWHDGQALTADDVVFTILTAQNADYGSTQRVNWQGVDIAKKDERTISFRLKNRYAPFLGNATMGILPKHVWETVKPSNFSLAENNLRPLGAGPYKFSKNKRDSTGTIRAIDLIAFDAYADGKPYIDRITFQFYNSEQSAIAEYNKSNVDGLSFVSAQQLDSLHLKNQLSIHDLHLPRYFGVFFNQNQSRQLSDKKVRLALNYATNKQEIIEKILNGKGTIVDSPLLPGIIDIPDADTKYGFDVEKAKALFEEAGWEFADGQTVRGKTIKTDGKEEALKLEIEITTSSWPELAAVADLLKSQWEAVGAHVTVTTLPVTEVQQAIKERDYAALLFGEVLGLEPDPFSFWHSSQKKDPGLNLALYDNKDADKILENARQIMDPAKRKEQYAKLQNIILNDVPVVFLYSPNYLYAQPKRIHYTGGSIIAVPSTRFDTVHEWYIDTERKKK